MKPFGLMADLHLHLWSQFNVDKTDGANGRLMGLLSEITRCAEEVRGAGGDTIYLAGDIFHVRGSVSPLVLNPALDLFRGIVDSGISVVVVPGNHDLAGKHTTRLGSAVTALEGAGVTVWNQTMHLADVNVLVVPWIEQVAELKRELTDRANAIPAATRQNTDVLIHAPVNGVIAGLPDHGLDPTWLGSLGFRRIFSGHYHNHNDFENGVYSIGALAHHTFSDIGSKAGFLIVGDEVRWMASHLPEFQDLDNLVALDPESIPLMVDGNYVRVKTELTKPTEIEAIKSELMGFGAAAVIVNSVRKPEARRAGAVMTSISAGRSLGASISEFVKAQSFKQPERVDVEAQRVLAEAGL